MENRVAMCSGSLKRNRGFSGPVKTVLPSFLSAEMLPSFLVWLGRPVFQWTVPRALGAQALHLHPRCMSHGSGLVCPPANLGEPWEHGLRVPVLWAFCRRVSRACPSELVSG